MAERKREGESQVPMRRGEGQGGEGVPATYGGPFTLIDWMFDRLQRDFFDEPFGFGRAMQPFGGRGERMPRLEVEEGERELIITAELPGIDPNDIQIECQDDVLTLRGERQEEQQQGAQGTRRAYARFFRQISLPPDVDLEKASASTRNGIVTIRFPRTEEARNVRRIPIERGETAPGGQKEQAA